MSWLGIIKGPHTDTNTDYVLTSKPQFLSLREERKLKIGTSTSITLVDIIEVWNFHLKHF